MMSCIVGVGNVYKNFDTRINEQFVSPPDSINFHREVPPLNELHANLLGEGGRPDPNDNVTNSMEKKKI